MDFVHKPVNKAVLRARIRLHRELVQAADQALAADCAKSAGLGKVGHELRTPMNHERGFTYLLGRELHSAREQELLAGVKAAQGHIALRVLLVGRHPHAASLRFDVQDQGIGLSADSQSRLFQALDQADNPSTRACDGLGLELALAGRLLDQAVAQRPQFQRPPPITPQA